jgi:hypothetical protein
VFFELGGKGLLYSINYDRTIPITQYFGSEIGTGLTFFEFFSTKIQILSPEVDLYYGITHKAEIGYSKDIVLNYINGAKLNSVRIGYRYQKPEGRFLFRASYCPYYVADSGGTWVKWAGVSFGFVF